MIPRLKESTPMKMIRPAVVITAVICAFLGFAAYRPASAADDWLPISAADLALKDNPADPGANAMILYRRSRMDARRAAIDGDSAEEYVRIKVFTEEGAREEMNPQIQFRKDESDIRDIRARTIRPDGTVANFDGQVFEKTIEQTSETSFLAKTFTLRDVVAGSIIEYKYRQQYKPMLLYSRSWIVSDRLYTRQGSFSIAPYVPRSSFDPTLFFRTTNLPPGSLPQRQGDGSYVMEVHDIKGLKIEPLMPPPRSLEARVEFFYRDRGTPVGESTEQFWNRVTKLWSDELDKFLNKKSVLDAELSSIVSPGDTPEIKLRKICARVQKIRDLSSEPAKSAVEKKAQEIKQNENVEDVLKRGYASGRQLNSLVVGLARAAGFEAAEVYLVPRNRDVFIPGGQSTSALTADIVWVRAGQTEYWLDPAAEYYPFGLIPWYETESKGVRVGKQGVEFVQTPASTSHDSIIVRSASLQLKDDGSADGKIRIDFEGESGASRRARYHRDDEAGRHKALQTEINRWLPAGSVFEVSDVANWDDISKPLHVEGSVTVTAIGAAAGHRMLVPVALFRTSYEESFAPEKRVNPIYFNSRHEEVDDVTYQIPAGFTIEAVPPKKTINPGTSLSYESSTAQTGGAFESKRHFVLNDIHYPRDSYSALRSFFENMKSSDEVQIILAGTDSTKGN